MSPRTVEAAAEPLEDPQPFLRELVTGAAIDDGHITPRVPKRCAQCKTPYWNKPRKKGVQSGPKEPTGEQIVAAHIQRVNAVLATGQEVLKQMKADKASWAQMAERVLRDFGVTLDKDQPKGLVR